jgi:ribosomal protein L37E
VSASPSTIDAAAPPWPLIHFDVHCARCGHDLRGQSEPVCPACSLAFTWDQAAPLEELTCGQCGYHLYGIADSRCPECGTAVDWNEALLRYRRREKPLFEYCWRDRPVRSFFHTWRLALWPRRFWRSIDVHDPPQILPLLAWLLAVIVVTNATCLTLLACTQWVMIWVQSKTWPGRWWLTLFSSIAEGFADWSWHLPMGLFVAWALLALTVLLTLRQSMRLCKVRTVHVVRVWAYAAAAGMPISALGILLGCMALGVAFGLLKGSYFWRYIWLYQVVGLFALIALVHSTVSLARGYSIYLKMSHSIGVAIAAQSIAGLAVLVIFLQLRLFGRL